VRALSAKAADNEMPRPPLGVTEALSGARMTWGSPHAVY
jgi:hypothetical protein